ncbi:uncharacterized protein EURHEDRAFT_414119 [Aspergillus ruber CBS 135680]|uniref:Uncharacterized protein n=1 Tax=Aspergillus ruber (strain CBS 135680) TaxID=1388766 RepID=A0A017SAP6_ASPRC|nr:uncharacterized protein EURHEDRAFT_414119 [Aspergillus ruber CBS 135680]EYE93704.1 hypothetical protein EURHEDRAFT_414119 [Aspergillus ruber CBS 135680]
MSSLGLVLAGGSTNAFGRMMENSRDIDPENGRHSRPWPRDVDATAPRMEMMVRCRSRRQIEETGGQRKTAYSSLLLSSCTRLDQIPFFISPASSGEASTSPISILSFYPIAL